MMVWWCERKSKIIGACCAKLFHSFDAVRWSLKGQFISKCLLGVIVSTKIPTEKFDKFCFRMGRAEFVNFFVGILVETMTPKRHFEIN